MEAKTQASAKNYINFRIFSHTMTYRQLQALAKKYCIPCNLKKDMLRDILDAKIRGNHDRVGALLHEVRASRLKRKLAKERELENQLENLTEEEKRQLNQESINLLKIKQEEDMSNDMIKHVPVKMFNGGGIVKEVVKKHSRKLTVCRTQLHTQYRTFVNPANHMGGYSAVNATSGYSAANPTSALSAVNPTTASSAGNPTSAYSAFNPTSGYSAVNSTSNFSHYNPHAHAYSRNSAPVWQGTSVSVDQRYSMPSSSATLPSLQGPFPPLHDIMNYSFQMPGSQQLDPPPILCPHPYNRFVYPVIQGPNTGLEQSCCSQGGPAYTYPVAVDHSYSNEPDSTQAQLPPFEMVTAPMGSHGNFTLATEQPFEDPQVSHVEVETDNSTALECLAEAAITLSENIDTPKHQDRPMIGEAPKEVYPKNYVSNELIVGSSKPTPEKDEILTWNHVLERISSNVPTPIQPLVSCRYGCRRVVRSREQQLNHETHCFLQPIQCPAPVCSWLSQLGSLDTHVFSIHNLEVIRSSNASFTLNFGSTMTYFGPAIPEGPKRLCFFQFVDRRIFVISVIYNYQKMQIYAFVQYVNDHLEMLSAAALEVRRVDGVPYQWKGRVLPLTYTAMHLVTRRRCLIFNICSANNFATNLTLHTRIRNHKLNTLVPN